MNPYKTTQAFTAQFIAPHAARIDEEARFPQDIFDEIAKAGYLALMIPKEYGGQGGTLSDHAKVCMALAEGSATVALCYMMHNVALSCINNHGDEALKQRIFADVVKNRRLLALAYSEVGTGTHFYKSELEARYSEQGVVLEGTKSMVTSGGHASYYLVLSPAKDASKLNNWVVPLESAGVIFHPSVWNGLGMRANVSSPMELQKVALDYSLRIGAEGSGLDQVFASIAPYFITGLAAIYSGLSLHIHAEALKHATTRHYAPDSSLAHIETVQIHLADLYASAVASQALTLEAARSYEAGEADALAKIIAARVKASEEVIENATKAMRVGGGKSYNKLTPLERLLRDSLAGQIMAPSVDVLKVWLGKALSGQSIL